LGPAGRFGQALPVGSDEINSQGMGATGGEAAIMVAAVEQLLMFCIKEQRPKFISNSINLLSLYQHTLHRSVL